MAASLPISSVAKPGRAVGQGANPGASPYAPSVLLPLRFVLAGVLALLVAAGCVLAQPELLSTYHYNQYVIAITHLVVLGFITTIVMGAMYQLVPVALETRLHSERLAAVQFLFHVAGFVGMVWMFWRWNLKGVGHFGVVLVIGVGMFVYNLARTLLRVPRWTVVATAVASALVWLTLAVTVGLTIAAGKSSYEISDAAAGFWAPLLGGLKSIAAFTSRFDPLAAMHAHAHLGVVGVFIILLVGISYKLVPMFTLSEIQRPRRAQASLWLLNGGLAGSFFAVLFRSQFKPVFGLIIAAGLLLYGLEIRAILKARKRRLLDWGLVTFLTAIGMLAPLAGLGLVLSWPKLPLTALTGQLENAYGFLALFGVVAFAIAGMLYKIVPFLVWYRVYSGRIGRVKVPSLAELYSARLQQIGFWTYLGGLGLTVAGIVPGNAQFVRAGGGLLLLSLAALAANLLMMCSHLFRAKAPDQSLRPAVAPGL